MPPQTNGITNRESSQPEFCNTIAATADITAAEALFRYWAMCGRLRVGKENLHLRRWSEQPCVRPSCAVLMTAGHNALRGSGPDQKHAFEDALAHVGCPDRRIDRRCISAVRPFQPLRHIRMTGCDLVHAVRAAGSL